MMLSHVLFVGALPPNPSFWETTVFQFNGLLIVFVALGALWLLMELTGFIFRRHDAKLAKSRAGEPCPAAATGAPTENNAELQTLAVIVTAVHVALRGRAHRVVSVTQAPQYDKAWAAEGRRDIFASRKVR